MIFLTVLISLREMVTGFPSVVRCVIMG